MDKRIVLIAVALILGSSAVADDIAVLRDPTMPLNGSGYSHNAGQDKGELSADGLRLQAVLMSSGVRYAVLDGQSYRQGQKYRDYVVKSITRDSVVLSTADGRESKTLWLFSNRVEK